MIRFITKKIINFLGFVKLVFTNPYFGFIQGHLYLSKNQRKEIKKIIGIDNHETNKIICEYESRFASIIGDGKCISFAAGRMAFYSLMKELNIGDGDEVIIQTSNCSVMVNAIMRLGATPVFSDIDLRTFGSNVKSITDIITTKTKLIVAQHTFGIPCDIVPIAEIAHQKGIFLLEDCALTVGSTTSGIQVGNFGDAALFSTDHSKPINTLIGGIIYTRNFILYENLKNSRDLLPSLSIKHQVGLYKQLLFERFFLRPNWYGFGIFISYLKICLKKLRIYDYLAPDLNNDSDIPSKIKTQTYPYPAKFPGFLAILGIHELERWDTIKKERNKLFLQYIDIMEQFGLSKFLPLSYFNKSLNIVPLRFAFMHPQAINIKKKMNDRFNISGYWFLQPIVACLNPLEFGYIDNSCPNSERMAKEIINLPCQIDNIYTSKILHCTKEAIKSPIYSN